MNTTPPAITGEVTIGPPVLNVQAAPPRRRGAGDAYTPVRALSPWNVACARGVEGKSAARRRAETTTMLGRIMGHLCVVCTRANAVAAVYGGSPHPLPRNS